VYASSLIDIIKLKEGIEGVKVRTTSGSVMVWYDPARIDPSEILTWLKKLTLWFYKSYTSQPFSSKRHIEPFLKKMHTRVRRLLHFDRHVNEENQG
jgi:hypothetical protein